MKSAAFTFIALFFALFLLFSIPVNEYLVTVEYNGVTDKILLDYNPEKLKQKCDLGVMYLQPWKKHFSEYPNEPGYWKVAITNIEVITKIKPHDQILLTSLVMAALLAMCLVVFRELWGKN